MATNKEDRSFKTLINRETTDSNNKFYFNEYGADTINIHADDVWAETIPYDDPTLGISLGRVEQQILFTLTEDLTVPDSQSWKAGIKDWISPKFGANYVAHLFDGSNNEIFPTDPLDWFFDYQTGILTFNGTLTRPTPLKITGYRYIGIKGVGGGPIELDILYSLTPLEVNVDYNDGTAVNPPADTYFSTQDEIDDFLILSGTSNFKHLQKIWDALPIFIFHAVTINLASGDHRAHSDVTDYAFNLSNKYLGGEGDITINGTPPSEWVDIITDQTITAHQTLSGVGDDFWNPWVQVSGTPFAGQDLKGLFAVLDTGQTTVIWDHDDNTLYLTAQLSPEPIDSVSTVRVSRPATVLQNSENGTTYKGSAGCMYIHNNNLGRYITFNNIWFQAFGRTWVVNSWGGGKDTHIAFNCLWDWASEKDMFGVNSGRGIQTSTGWFMFGCSFRSRSDVTNQNPIFLYFDGQIGFFQGYIGGCRYYISISDNALMSIYSSVINDIGYTVYYGVKTAIQLFDNAQFTVQHVSYYGGKRTTFIAGSNTGNAIYCESGSKNIVLRKGFTNGIWFRGFSAPVLSLGDAGIDLTDADPGWFNDPTADDDANSDVGIEVGGSGQRIKLGSNVEIRGTVGDLRLEGVVGSYTDLPPSTNPLVTQRLNIISRD